MYQISSRRRLLSGFVFVVIILYAALVVPVATSEGSLGTTTLLYPDTSDIGAPLRLVDVELSPSKGTTAEAWVFPTPISPEDMDNVTTSSGNNSASSSSSSSSTPFSLPRRSLAGPTSFEVLCGTLTTATATEAPLPDRDNDKSFCLRVDVLTRVLQLDEAAAPLSPASTATPPQQAFRMVLATLPTYQWTHVAITAANVTSDGVVLIRVIVGDDVDTVVALPTEFSPSYSSYRLSITATPWCRDRRWCVVGVRQWAGALDTRVIRQRRALPVLAPWPGVLAVQRDWCSSVFYPPYKGMSLSYSPTQSPGSSDCVALKHPLSLYPSHSTGLGFSGGVTCPYNALSPSQGNFFLSLWMFVFPAAAVGDGNIFPLNDIIMRGAQPGTNGSVPWRVSADENGTLCLYPAGICHPDRPLRREAWVDIRVGVNSLCPKRRVVVSFGVGGSVRNRTFTGGDPAVVVTGPPSGRTKNNNISDTPSTPDLALIRAQQGSLYLIRHESVIFSDVSLGGVIGSELADSSKDAVFYYASHVPVVPDDGGDIEATLLANLAVASASVVALIAAAITLCYGWKKFRRMAQQAVESENASQLAPQIPVVGKQGKKLSLCYACGLPWRRVKMCPRADQPHDEMREEYKRTRGPSFDESDSEDESASTWMQSSPPPPPPLFTPSYDGSGGHYPNNNINADTTHHHSAYCNNNNHEEVRLEF
eukprot:PhM_4_TR15883/c0_g1_i1/m.16936